MARSTRENLIVAGLELFCENGFNAVGLDQILRRVGVTKTTFYNYFESKEQLICEVIELHVQQRLAQLKEGMEHIGGDDPKKKLLAIFDVLNEIFSKGSSCGCLIINALIEFPSLTDPVHKTASVLGDKWDEFIRQTVIEAGYTNADPLALKLRMLYDGAVLACHTYGNRDAALQAREAAKMLLQASG